MTSNALISKRICSECGKEIIFYNFGLYAWKKHIKGNTKYYCSYTCMRKVEARLEEEQKKKKKANRQKQMQRRAMQV